MKETKNMGRMKAAEEKRLRKVNEEQLEKFYLKHKPWDKLPNEPDSAFQCFVRFRDMPSGERSIVGLARAGFKTQPHLNQLSMKHHWFERAAQWDVYVDKKKQEVYLKTIEEMTKRHAQHSMALETAFMLPVQTLLEKARIDSRMLESLTVKELLDAVFSSADKFTKIVDVERKSRGVATDLSKVAVDTTTNGESIKPAINIIINGSKSRLLEEAEGSVE